MRVALERDPDLSFIHNPDPKLFLPRKHQRSWVLLEVKRGCQQCRFPYDGPTMRDSFAMLGHSHYTRTYINKWSYSYSSSPHTAGERMWHEILHKLQTQVFPGLKDHHQRSFIIPFFYTYYFWTPLPPELQLPKKSWNPFVRSQRHEENLQVLEKKLNELVAPFTMLCLECDNVLHRLGDSDA